MIDHTALTEPKPVHWSVGLTPAVAAFRRSVFAGNSHRSRGFNRVTSDYFEIGVAKRELYRL